MTVPVGATRFQLGINDDIFDDNTGELNVSINFTPVPEPTSLALLATGLGLLMARRIHRVSVLREIGTALMILAIVPSAAGAVGLEGADVSVAIYWPTESSRVSNLAMATVGPELEFPVGSLYSTGGVLLNPVAIDVAPTTIDLVYDMGVIAGAGAFNGYIFQFSGAPDILGVEVGALSTFSPTGLSFTKNSVLVDIAGQIHAGSSRPRLQLDVTSVPEPASNLLVAAGSVGLAVGRKRKANYRRTPT
jgi:hypothetical protein